MDQILDNMLGDDQENDVNTDVELNQIVTSAYTGLAKRLIPVGDHAALKNNFDNNPVLQHA